MKKVFKSILAIMLVISLALVVTGCGNNDEANKENNAKSKTYTVLSKAFSGDSYIMTLEGNMDLGEGVENSTMTLAMRGEDIYMDVDATSGHLTIMYKDNTTYVVSHADKMYMTLEGKDEEVFEEDDMFAFSKGDLQYMETAKYNKGKEAVDGTEYDYEEYKDEEAGTTERYYFSGEDLKYIKTTDANGQEEIMKVVKLSSDVEDSIFNLPTDYQKVQM